MPLSIYIRTLLGIKITVSTTCKFKHILGFPDSSVGKESASKAGEPSSTPGSIPGKIHWRTHRLPIPVFLGFPCGSAGEESSCNVKFSP